MDKKDTKDNKPIKKNRNKDNNVVPIKDKKFTNVKKVVEVKRGKGRPQKEVDIIAVEELASYGCIKSEIASYLGISHDTLSRRPEAEEAYQKGLDKCKRSIRRKQYESAMEGNTTMQIWLGKILLGQKEQTEQKLTVEGGEKPIKIMPVTERIKAYEHLWKEEIST